MPDSLHNQRSPPVGGDNDLYVAFERAKNLGKGDVLETVLEKRWFVSRIPRGDTNGVGEDELP